MFRRKTDVPKPSEDISISESINIDSTAEFDDIKESEEIDLEAEDDEDDVSDNEGGVDNVVEESKAWEGKGVKLLHIHEEEANIRYAEEYIDGFRQFKYLASIMLRFPFDYSRLENGQFKFHWSAIQGIFFLITGVLIAIISILYSYNILSMLLNHPQMNVPSLADGGNKWNARAEEMFIFYRNCAMAVMFAMLLLHVCVANWKIFRMREYIATYLGYFTNALDLMKLNSAEGLARYIFFINLGLLAFIFALIGLMISRISPITSGGPGFLGILMVRGFKPDIYQDENVYNVLKIFAQAFLVYLLISAKIYIIFFIFQCRVIGGAFHLWNQRLDIVLNRGDNFLVMENRLGKRTSFRELFEDHTVLLDLIDGADMLFADTIESYFVAQVLSMIFEMYWFWRCLSGDEFNDVRKLDIFFILIYLLHSFVFLLLASFSSANVAEEAMDGLEAIRRKGMFGRKSPEELYFLMSLYVSYSGHYDISISAGGYSNIDRSFLVALAGTILSYFIVLIQFSHPLGYAVGDPLSLLVRDEAKLIRQVEDTIIQFQTYGVEVGDVDN